MKDTLNIKIGHLFLIAIVIASMAALAWATTSSTPQERDTSYQRYFNENYKIFSLTIPENLDFAGEKLPLEIDDVKERLDRELLVNTYWQSQTLLFFKRSNRWFPVIEPILEKEGVPNDFKYLAVIESGLDNVVSPAGATGYWQIMRETGREFGLEINNEVDERYHVEKSTVAACKYLKQAYKKYGSWTLAAASYNMGMRGLERQMERQKVDDYYDLLLNTETGRYVFRILAIKEILSKPAQYGFHFRPKDLYAPYETYDVVIHTAIHDFAEFAFENHINYKTLKLHNPWLRDSFLTNPRNKEYTLKLPSKNMAELVSFPHDDEQNTTIDTLHSDSIFKQ